MRKVIIEVSPKFVLKLLPRFLPEDFLDNVEYIEGKALLRLDFEKGVKIAIIDVKMKEGKTINDLKIPDELATVDVLREKDNIYTCLMKATYKKSLLNLAELQPLKVLMSESIIFDFPFILSKEKIVITMITDNRYLKKVLQGLKPLGFVKNISFQKATFSEYNILSCLTERQKEIIIAAQKNGYYEVPREITAEELSKKLGISKATTVEHLRKAENRIISHIVAGY